jgi:hypothetical protein
LHRLRPKNERCPTVGKRFNFAAKARELELIAEQVQRRTVFVSEVGIVAFDRPHKKAEDVGTNGRTDMLGVHEEHRVVQEDCPHEPCPSSVPSEE